MSTDKNKLFWDKVDIIVDYGLSFVVFIFAAAALIAVTWEFLNNWHLNHLQ